MRYIAEKIRSLLLLLLVATIIMSPVLFCGFEWCDTGFYMTFYDNLFSHPEAVSYNFMYYLSGLIGALALKIWNSILCIRVLGLLFYLGCIWLMWYITRRDGIFLPQLLAVILISAGVLFTPLAFYNDILSVFLALSSLALMSETFTAEDNVSISRRQIRLLLFSGLIAGINTYSRIPNILEILFVFIIPCVVKRERGQRMTIWIGGWFAGIIAGLSIVALLGHLPIFADMLRDLFTMGSSRGRESTHAIGYLVMVQLVSWRSVAFIALEIFLIYFVARLVFNKVRISSLILRGLLGALFYALALYLLWSDYLPSVIGISFAGLLILLLNPFKDKYPQEIKVQSLMALFMIFIIPLGSDNAVFCCGTILLSLSLPLSLVPFCRSGKLLPSIACVILALKTIIGFCNGDVYFDDTPVAEMRPVNVHGGYIKSRLKGVLTSRERSQRLVEIYDEVSSVVSPGDTLMVYGSAPMLNYLTGSVPAYGCSWPELLTAAQIGSRLESGQDPQYIVVFKFQTIGKEWNAPSVAFMRAEEGTTNRYHQVLKSREILQFLEKNNYCLVKDKEDFSLYKRSSAD